MIWIPLGDENPCRRRAVVHWIVWLACLAGSAATFGLGWAPWKSGIPVAINLVLLLMLGDNVEDRLGRWGYLGFTIAAAAVGSAAALLVVGGWEHAYVAIHAVCAAAIGAYVVWWPAARIRGALLAGRERGEPWVDLPLPAWVLVALWLAGHVVALAFTGVTPTAAAVGTTFLAGAVFAVAERLARPAPATKRAVVTGKAAEPARARRIRAEAQAVPEMEAAPAAELANYLEAAGERVALPVLGGVGGERWAVIRTDDKLENVPRLGRIVAAYTGEPLVDATMRIRKTRGVLARGAAEDAAQAMARELGEAEIGCEVVPDGPHEALPDAVEIVSGAVDEKGFRLELANGYEVEAPWVQVFLVAGAEFVLREMPEVPSALSPIVEVHNAQPRLRMRAVRFRSRLGPGGIRTFAAQILKHRKATAANPGVSVIAHGGRFGYLSFDRACDLDDYVWWLAQIVRRPGAPARNYLE